MKNKTKAIANRFFSACGDVHVRGDIITNQKRSYLYIHVPVSNNYPWMRLGSTIVKVYQ